MANEVSQRIKLMNTGNLDEWYGPYANFNAANLAVPQAIRAGKTIGINSPSGIVEYWWRNGTADNDLVSKSSGGSGGDVGLVINEVPEGEINGSNATFTSNFSFVPESVSVFSNGLNLKPIDEYTTTGNTQIQLTFSPQVGEIILINYIKA